MDDIFCKIIKGEAPTQFVYRDEEVVAFNDIHPKAPVHILIVPKKHIASVSEAQDEDQALLGKMLLTAKKIAQEKGIEDFQLKINNGEGAGQDVFHLHLHLLGYK